ncbi:MAG: 2-oxoglutarate oxidoreductase [Mogibacterium sp.]|nr:2-oxoglutarate oxidoreductase [Mogibacterium sp.]
MEKIYGKSDLLLGSSKFCPGCGHGVVNKLIAEVLEENGWVGNAVECLCIGCAINMANYVDWDIVFCPHGRAAAVATGVSRVNKDAVVFSYQGDGDAAGIGLAESFHSASRGEGFVQIVVNNQIYGMTGGQTSPMTLIGQKTTTSGPNGRDPLKTGYPTHLAETMALIEAAGVVARGSVHNPKEILRTKKLLEKAFRLQVEEHKYSYIEIVSMCPTDLHMQPDKMPDYIEKNVLPVYPLGQLK